MKKVFFLTLLFVSVRLLQAQNAEEILTQTSQLFGAGKYHEAAKLIETHKPQLQKSDYYVSFLTMLGLAYTMTGNYPQAETSYIEEKAVYEKTMGKEHSGYITATTQLGYIYRQMGDYAKAEPCYLEVKSIREKVSGKNHADYASAVNQLAGLYNDMGDYTRAVKYYLEAKTIQEKVEGKENITYADIVNNLATAYRNMGEYAKAETFFREAMTVGVKVVGKDNANYALYLSNLGSVYHIKGDYTQAEKFYGESKTIYEKIVGKAHPAYASALQNLGLLYNDKGDVARAETSFQEEKAIWEKWFGKENSNHITSLNNLGNLYLTAKNYTKAESVKTEVDQIVTGQIGKSFTTLSERQRSLFWDKNNHHFEAGYSYAHAYPSNSMVAHTYDNTLFTKGLLLRTTNGIRDAIYSSGNKALINQYEELTAIRQTIGALQAKSPPDLREIGILEDRADNLDKTITTASAAYRDIKKDISMNWQNVRDALQSGEAAIEFVHFRLYGKKGFTDNVLYCAMLLKKDSKAPVWIPLCDEKQMQALTKRDKDMSDEDFTQQLYSEKGDNLFRLIWQPLEKELQGIRTIYYSPSGMLHQIAFSAIPAADGRDAARHRLPRADGVTTLSDKYDLQLVSSTRELTRLKKDKTGTLPKGTAAVYGGLYYNAEKDQLIAESRKARRAATPTQGIGTSQVMIAAVFPKNIQRGGTWSFLPGTQDETEQICEYLNKRKIPNRLYSEIVGNEESFKQLSGTPAGIIHLATHGFFLQDIEDEDNRDVVQRLGGGGRKAFENPLLRSGLLMAGANRAWTGEDVIEGIEDGILTADEIAQMNLIKTQLVVLSACETGLGEAKSSEGVFGLQRAFKLAGVETLVMSLWTVPDDATAELMTGFYQLWLSGKTKREAFATAQKQVREKYKEPYYWAGFVMMD